MADLATWCSRTRTLDSISAGSQGEIVGEAVEQTTLLLEKRSSCLSSGYISRSTYFVSKRHL